ncbi:MAG: type II toxin-antitoxin system RelE/ParE family toxin [Alphaproteobacteria bacterium]
MSVAYVLSPAAQHDLGKIWDYSYASWGKDRADAYLREIRAALTSIATAPQLGRECAFVRAGYRKYPVGSHILFYRLLTNGIDVIRILHQRMDADRNL